MASTKLQFIVGWLLIPWRIISEIFKWYFPPTHDCGEEQGLEGVPKKSDGDATIDERELAHWTKLSNDWWDPEGDFALLLGYNNCRIPMIVDAYAKHIAKKVMPGTSSLRGAKIIDVGCGAGFVAEPLTELGADVTAVDMVPAVIQLAESHWKAAHGNAKGPEYICAPVEQISTDRAEEFDMVLCLEVLDHVANNNWKEFAAHCCRLLRPGGCAIFSTFNQTLASLMIGIIGYEHILRVIPMDTHHLYKFIKPEEVEREIKKHGLETIKLTGCIPTNPWATKPIWENISWSGFNYAIVAIKPRTAGA